MINKGFACIGYWQKRYGKPFIAAFDIHDGDCIFLRTIDYSNDPVNGYLALNDTILLVFKDRITKYSLIDGSLIYEKRFNIKDFGELNNFVDGLVYFNSPPANDSLEPPDPSKHYLITNSGKILVINDDLDILDQVDYDQTYRNYLETSDYKFLAKGNETIVIDHDNNIVAKLKASSNAILIGSKLYDRQGGNFIEIDLNESMNN